MPQARDLLVLELERHRPGEWKQVFNSGKVIYLDILWKH